MFVLAGNDVTLGDAAETAACMKKMIEASLKPLPLTIILRPSLPGRPCLLPVLLLLSGLGVVRR